MVGLRANKYTETLKGETGWSRFQERIEKEKVKYEIRLESINDTIWAKVCTQCKSEEKMKETNRDMKKLCIKIKNDRGQREIPINGNIIKVNESHK